MFDLFGNKKRDAEIERLREQLDALWRWAEETSKQTGKPPPVTPQGGGGSGPPPK